MKKRCDECCQREEDGCLSGCATGQVRELRAELARVIRTMLYGTVDQVWALKRLAELEPK